MNISRWLGRGFAQAGKAAQLAVDVSGKFCVGQHERIFSRDIRAADGTYQRFGIFRQRRKAVRSEAMRVKLRFFIRCVKTTRRSFLGRHRIFSIAGSSAQRDSSGGRFNLI